MGSLDTDIAQFLEVAVSTIYEWKNAFPQFSEAIKRGKAVCDREVAGKLIERAMGAKHYQQKEVKLKSVKYDKKTFKKVSEEERVEVVTLEAMAPPDTQALIFFLKNRRPDLYREKSEHLLGSDPSNPLPSQTVVYLPSNGRETK